MEIKNQGIEHPENSLFHDSYNSYNSHNSLKLNVVYYVPLVINTTTLVIILC